MDCSPERIQHFVRAIEGQFYNRTVIEANKTKNDFGIKLNASIDEDNILWFSFNKDGETHHVTMPIPYKKNGVFLIRNNEVTRAICPFWLEESQREVDYLAAMYAVIMGEPTGMIDKSLVKPTPYLQQVIYGFRNGNASVIIYRFQKAINEVINRMPLHETFMNSFVMNNRLMIIDPRFEELRSPADKLAYQKDKAIKYFDRGWTAIGLADGSLAGKNYLLKINLRDYTPFGKRFHNPQRNLYSTLGMKGEELPNIRSKSMQDLIDMGITRKGWNLFTAFADIPDNFEDQIVVDNSLKDKSAEYTRRFQIFGSLLVKEGQSIKTGAILGIASDDEKVLFNVACDNAVVEKISEAFTSVGGTRVLVHNVIVKYERKFCDGVKFTNLHGNKGVVHFEDLGFAIDPRTGCKRKLQVIVAGKTVPKRKNFGQIHEALINCVMEHGQNSEEVNPIIIPDDWSQPTEQIHPGLVKRGFRSDGTWDCDTYAGKFRAVCGKIFWGVIKTPHDDLWKHNATTTRNGKEVRTAGIKFSHVEFKAIETRFGEENPVLDEIMSYAQGSENVHDMLKMLRCVVGDYSNVKCVMDPSSVKPVDQTNGTIVPKEFIDGTVVDEFFIPDGFMFKLPIPYQVILDKEGEVLHSGVVVDINNMSEENRSKVDKVNNIDRLYFPSGTLRKCWRHASGSFGLSEIGVLVNNVVVMTRRLIANPGNDINLRLYYGTIEAYFNKIAAGMGSKRGELATLTMAVRYPFSAKATATLSTQLPKNTVGIHRSMAEVLRVNEGDVVLVERFPCLGFMSVRPQKVHIHDNPMQKYVIQASGNSLVSLNLDFDGDTLFLASFHTKEAKEVLLKEWTNPNKTCYNEIDKLNKRKGAPHVKGYSLDDYNINPYEDMTCLEHAEIVEKNTGVKAQTGPVIALTYNIMRIVEDSNMARDQKMKVAVEMFLEKAAQSVFEQKHGGKSLYEIVIDGVCTADVDMLVDVGFKRGTTEKLCDLIRKRAAEMGIFNLKAAHEKAKVRGQSNLISRIVRLRNHIYFASRSSLGPVDLLAALEKPAVDIPSRMYKWVMSGRIGSKETILDKLTIGDKIKEVRRKSLQEVCESLCGLIDNLFEYVSPMDRIQNKGRELSINYMKSGFGIARTFGNN